MSSPKPGKSVRGSRTGRPIMALLDLLGRRWSMRVLWELNIKPCTFRELQSCCDDISSSVLNTRLGELKEASLIELGENGFFVTPLGKELMVLISPLREWAEKWDKQLSRDT